jgi:O-antigen/teichoic acid export membrane protein
LFKNISTVFLMDNIAKLVGMVTTLILIRMLPKEDYALYTFFWSAAMFFVGFVSSGIDMAYVRFAAEEYSDVKKMPNDIFFFSIILCFSAFLILSPVTIAFSKQLSLLMFKSGLYSKPIFVGYLAAIGLFLFAFGTRYYQVQEKYGTAGVLISLQKILFLLFLFVLIASGNLGFLKVAIAQIIAITGFGIFLISMVIKNDLLKEGLFLSFNRFVVFMRASFWLILYFISLSLFNQLDVFMISRFMSVDNLANYGVAFKYYGLLMLMFPAIKTVLKVRTSKIDMVNSTERQRIFFKKWIKLITLVSVPIISLVVLFSDYFMNLLNGPRYAASILPFKILAVCAMCSYIFSPNTDIFRAMGKYFLLFCFGLVALIVNFFGNLMLIPVYGIAGAAIATLAAHLLINGSATVYLMAKS